MRKIMIFDTTLRDGEQSPGASMNVEEKLQVARQLAALRIALEAPHGDVLADLADQALAHVFQGGAEAVLAVGQRRQRGHVGRVAGGEGAQQ